jgi:hypothetical protein
VGDIQAQGGRSPVRGFAFPGRESFRSVAARGGAAGAGAGGAAAQGQAKSGRRPRFPPTDSPGCPSERVEPQPC